MKYAVKKCIGMDLNRWTRHCKGIVKARIEKWRQGMDTNAAAAEQHSNEMQWKCKSVSRNGIEVNCLGGNCEGIAELSLAANRER